jgi:hypothetical protein
MRQIISVFAASACLAGCVAPDLRQTGTLSEHTLQLPPLKAAQCVTRNAKDYHSWYEANIQGIPMGLEVVVVSFGKKIAVAEIKETTVGPTTASIYQEKSWLVSSALAAAMAKGC